MGVNHADVLAVVFSLDKALHDFFTFTAGKVAGLGADDLDVWRFGDGFSKAFLTVDGHARPDGALQLNDVTRLAVDLFHQPVTNQLPFKHVVGGDGGHIERFVFYIDGTIEQEHRNFSVFRFLQNRLPSRRHDRSNKDGIHALGDKRAHGFDLVFLLLLTIGDFQGDAAFLSLAFRNVGFCRTPAGFRANLRKTYG